MIIYHAQLLTECPSQVCLTGSMIKGLALEFTTDAILESLTDRSVVVVAIMTGNLINCRIWMNIIISAHSRTARAQDNMK